MYYVYLGVIGQTIGIKNNWSIVVLLQKCSYANIVVHF